ncbi:DNA polymerase-3 subunit epsilon [Bosea sp. BE271]|jgi:DNA polymerase III subunit epsilon|uniref:3'-5' exonuclease n=1 Tax=Bosea TaxID=85413 RepID=UPI0027417A3D|nr:MULTISPECIES: 3'-5' exonuclease [Bosea]MDR6831648.1 DNA polymerase-3 subunit epsilon [Bosea robiniae]MDR6898348.1 DNA polymerase-3 subunit epsilon [Bosea sp. BE109]MDR7141745.1 DNA polymerase-3 subunit epsilon [Bosea sp. BE168]MDR7178364.1 DNA polymerase-3 subunit epsilon [Bosea sp. BE271]
MKIASTQIDLFDDAPGYRQTPRPSPKKRKCASSPPSTGDADEATAQRLEQTGRFKVLRRLVPRPIVPRAHSPFPNLAVLVDTETTGLQHARDEIIEIGAVAFTYDSDGAIGDVVGVYSGLRQPSEPIPAEITRLTGITDEIVAGHDIDLDALHALIEPADLIIAHNAAFDRPFCERLSPAFVSKAWACSVTEIRWSDVGFEGNKLGYLVGQSGLFHDGHRATDDCNALLEVLARPAGPGGARPFAELLRSSASSRIRIYAEHAPFDMKDHLKGRGYRWSDGSDGRPRAWWIEIDEELYEEELRYLRTEIYQWADAEPLTVRLTALDRFRG